MDSKRISITVRANTPIEEFNYLKYIIVRLPFYMKHGYQVGLPDIDELKSEKVLSNENHCFDLFLDKEYQVEFFENGISKAKEMCQIIEESFPKLVKLHDLWGFKIFNTYQILLTKYGPGGSYNEKKGSVIMKTMRDGTFGRNNPEQTIAHEIIHIGVEECIIEKFKLNHTEKERLVDLMVKNLYKDVFPNYRIQMLGETNIDPYVTRDTISTLSTSIEEFTSNRL